ncbi:MAG: hypothetical protein RMI91_08460 [Gemmatales bacterium]|nr:hypothetical protein [Gemmatales bacterium]MDW8223950.1 hypothetical protein [Gemmatales bacterium]
MLKSWKFWSIVGTVAFVASSVGLNTSWGYVKTLFRWTGQTVRQNVPLDFEIERLETYINDARKELRQHEQAVARMQVEIEHLQDEVKSTRADVERAKAELRKLRDYLEQAKETGSATIGDRTYSKREIEAEIRRRLQRLQYLEDQLKLKETTLEKRTQALDQAKDAVEKSRLAIDKLIMHQQQLKEMKRLLDMQPEGTTFTVDASKLQEAQKLAQEIEIELRTRQRQREQMLSSGGEIRIELDDRPLEEQLREKLGD